MTSSWEWTFDPRTMSTWNNTPEPNDAVFAWAASWNSSSAASTQSCGAWSSSLTSTVPLDFGSNAFGGAQCSSTTSETRSLASHSQQWDPRVWQTAWPTGAACAYNPVSHGSADVAHVQSAPPVAAAASIAVKVKKKAKVKQSVCGHVSLMPTWTRRMGLYGGYRNRKGEGKSLPPDDPSTALTRCGVYGFRPESSSEDEIEEVVAFTPRIGYGSMGCAAMSNLDPVGRTTPINKPAAFGEHYYCSIHNKRRAESDLMDDGEGKPTCRPGRECP